MRVVPDRSLPVAARPARRRPGDPGARSGVSRAAGVSLGLLVLAFLPRCTCGGGGDAGYVRTAESFLRRGPSVACCTVMGGSQQTGAEGEACRQSAAQACGFLVDAELSSTIVMTLGGDDGAVVDVRVRGPHGRGRCKVQVVRDSAFASHVQGSGCAAE